MWYLCQSGKWVLSKLWLWNIKPQTVQEDWYIMLKIVLATFTSHPECGFCYTIIVYCHQWKLMFNCLYIKFLLPRNQIQFQQFHLYMYLRVFFWLRIMLNVYVCKCIINIALHVVYLVMVKLYPNHSITQFTLYLPGKYSAWW